MNLPSAVVLICMSAALFFGAIPPKAAVAQGGAAVEIGQTVPAEKLHIVTEPGRYGLGPELPGSHYAVVDNLLVRIDAKTGAVQSIIRKVDGIRD